MNEFNFEPEEDMSFFGNGNNNSDQPDYETLLSELADPEKPLSLTAYPLLSDMPGTVFNRVVSLWPTVDAEKRDTIARTMADIAEDNYQVDYAPFFNLFTQDERESVRLAGLDILWDSDNTDLVRPIIEIMQNDASTEVRASATATLGHFIMMAQWGEISEVVEGPILDALFEVLDNPVTPLLMRKAALESVAPAPHPRVKELIQEAYDKGDDSMQISAVFSMGRSADPYWVPTLRGELESIDSEMRLEAARAIGTIGDSSSSDELAELAKHDEDLEVRLASIHALSQIGNQTAAAVLSQISEEDDNEEIQEAVEEAIESMAMIGLDIDLSLIDFDAGLGDDDSFESDPFA